MGSEGESRGPGGDPAFGDVTRVGRIAAGDRPLEWRC